MGKQNIETLFFNLSDDECMQFTDLLVKQTMKEDLKIEIMKLRDTKDSRMKEMLEKIIRRF